MKIYGMNYHNKISEWLALETISDVFDYAFSQQEEMIDDLQTIIRNGIAWDHLGDVNSSIRVAAANAFLKGGNPLFDCSSVLKEKIERFLDLIDDGKIVLVNPRGGYHYIIDGNSIQYVKDYIEEEKPQTAFLNDESEIIVLENDPILDSWSVNYFRDTNISKILSLRKYSSKELTDILHGFRTINDKEKTVFIYTTALDIEQMYWYIDAISKSGIKNITWKISSSKSNEIHKAVTYAKDKHLNVDIEYDVI